MTFKLATDVWEQCLTRRLCKLKCSQDNTLLSMYDKETERLIEEVREKICILRERGVQVEELFRPPVDLSRLKVTTDLKILLVDKDNQELKMPPILKTLYLLFLRHEEGIEFKRLSEYREELLMIYKRFKINTQAKKRIVRSIDDLTDPLNNSVCEKVAKIKKAILSKLDERTAQFYIIQGKQGEKKSITLPRNLVAWEEESPP